MNWLVDVQQGDNLSAIGAMNDLLVRFPNDKHVLYLTSEWLYMQQDYGRARKMMEKILDIDPNFPPALNMLGYSYIETGDPDPAKAVNFLQRYATLEPNQPNPQDSLGEVSPLCRRRPRLAGTLRRRAEDHHQLLQFANRNRRYPRPHG